MLLPDYVTTIQDFLRGLGLNGRFILFTLLESGSSWISQFQQKIICDNSNQFSKEVFNSWFMKLEFSDVQIEPISAD